MFLIISGLHSAPIEHVLRKELEDFVGKGDYVFFSQETEITWNVWTEGNILGNSVATHGKNLIFKADKGSFVLTPESVSVKGFGSASRLDIKTASIFRRERRLSSINRSPGFWMATKTVLNYVGRGGFRLSGGQRNHPLRLNRVDGRWKQS